VIAEEAQDVPPSVHGPTDAFPGRPSTLRTLNCPSVSFADTSPARRYPTSGYSSTPPARWSSSSRPPGAPAPRTWWWARWSSCSGWPRWCRHRARTVTCHKACSRRTRRCEPAR